MDDKVQTSCQRDSERKDCWGGGMNDWQMARQILNPITPLEYRMPTSASQVIKPKKRGKTMTEEVAREIREMYSEGMSITAIAVFLGLCHRTVKLVIAGQRFPE